MSAIRCARCERPSVARVTVWVIQDSAVSPAVPRDYCADHLAEAQADPTLSVTAKRDPVEELTAPTDESVVRDALRSFIRDRAFLDPMKGGSSSFYTTPQEADHYKEQIAIAERLLYP